MMNDSRGAAMFDVVDHHCPPCGRDDRGEPEEMSPATRPGELTAEDRQWVDAQLALARAS
jgi:hypothetical protein